MISETSTYLDRLQDRRKEILQTIEGLDSDALNWQPLPHGTNSVAILAIHSLGAERMWIHHIVGGNPIERDRDAEFRARLNDVVALKASYAAAALETERILTELMAEELDVPRTYGRYTDKSVRWCILHVIEHYSEHLAQMWLTRQLWQDQKKT